MNLQIMVGLTGRLLWVCDPLLGATHDAKAIATSGILEDPDPRLPTTATHLQRNHHGHPSPIHLHQPLNNLPGLLCG